MKFKKIISVVTLLAVATATFAGCESTSTSSKADDTSSKAEESKADESKADESKADESKEDVTPSGETIKLTVWDSQEGQDLLKQKCEAFAAANPDKKYEFTYGVVSEADAKSEVLKDPTAAADVFNFSSDQTGELVSAGALYKVTKNKDQIIADNSEGSISASSVDGELYAYPSSTETYFLYYDKSKLSDKDVLSLESILAINPDGVTTNIAFDLDNGWYSAGFFFGAGCTLFGPDGTDDTQCDFNNEQGKLVGEYFIDLVANSKFGNNMGDDLIKAGFSDGTLAAAVSGAWNAADIQASLGDNYAATKLPTFTLGDGKTYQMSSMANFKLVGVNSSTKNPVEAMALAEFLTNYDNQLLNFEQRSFAPTNKKLAEDSEKMASNAAVAAVAYQGQFATLQTAIPQIGKYWTPAEAFGAGVISGEVTKDNVQEKLDQFVEAVLASLT